MARKELGTWVPNRAMWRHMISGKVYTISCKRLLCPPTKLGSYQAARQYFERKHSELTLQAVPGRLDYLVRELENRKAWLDSNGLNSAHVKDIIAYVLEMERDGLDSSLADADARIDPDNEVWKDRLSRFKPSETDRTVKVWTDKYMALRLSQVNAGELSIDDYDMCRVTVAAYAEWLGSTSSVDKIQAQNWTDWYQYLLSCSFGAAYKIKHYNNSRSFVSWMIEQSIIPAFASLLSKRYRFKTTQKEVITLPVDTVRQVVGSTTGILKGVLLLMLNCGFTQKDTSDLKVSQYHDGIITRVRSKMARRGGRTVSWKLWDITSQALAPYLHTGKRLLQYEGGNLIRDEIINGIRSKTDHVSKMFIKLDAPFTMRQLRQFSGDSIKRQRGKETADHFLGHGKKPVDAAYFSSDQEKLDAAIAWLGEYISIRE